MIYSMNLLGVFSVTDATKADLIHFCFNAKCDSNRTPPHSFTLNASTHRASIFLCHHFDERRTMHVSSRIEYINVKFHYRWLNCVNANITLTSITATKETIFAVTFTTTFTMHCMHIALDTNKSISTYTETPTLKRFTIDRRREREQESAGNA